mmetsp:Transcript_26495/g.84844  ORF Transcript_26495/g.84844 Transcript_26495/m.84844 type:complete len:413 (+) Transcript_26495:353-1591(+)
MVLRARGPGRTVRPSRGVRLPCRLPPAAPRCRRHQRGRLRGREEPPLCRREGCFRAIQGGKSPHLERDRALPQGAQMFGCDRADRHPRLEVLRWDAKVRVGRVPRAGPGGVLLPAPRPERPPERHRGGAAKPLRKSPAPPYPHHNVQGAAQQVLRPRQPPTRQSLPFRPHREDLSLQHAHVPPPEVQQGSALLHRQQVGERSEVHGPGADLLQFVGRVKEWVRFLGDDVARGVLHNHGVVLAHVVHAVLEFAAPPQHGEAAVDVADEDVDARRARGGALATPGELHLEDGLTLKSLGHEIGFLDHGQDAEELLLQGGRRGGRGRDVLRAAQPRELALQRSTLRPHRLAFRRHLCLYRRLPLFEGFKRPHFGVIPRQLPHRFPHRLDLAHYRHRQGRGFVRAGLLQCHVTLQL